MADPDAAADLEMESHRAKTRAGIFEDRAQRLAQTVKTVERQLQGQALALAMQAWRAVMERPQGEQKKLLGALATQSGPLLDRLAVLCNVRPKLMNDQLPEHLAKRLVAAPPDAPRGQRSGPGTHAAGGNAAAGRAPLDEVEQEILAALESLATIVNATTLQYTLPNTDAFGTPRVAGAGVLAHSQLWPAAL